MKQHKEGHKIDSRKQFSSSKLWREELNSGPFDPKIRYLNHMATGSYAISSVFVVWISVGDGAPRPGLNFQPDHLMLIGGQVDLTIAYMVASIRKKSIIFVSKTCKIFKENNIISFPFLFPWNK